MRKGILCVIVCLMLLMTKYVVSGGYYDYTLRLKNLQEMQDTLLDGNKRAIATLENFRSANYLFSKKEEFGLQELTPDRAIILRSVESQ